MTQSKMQQLPSIIAMILDTFVTYQDYCIPHLMAVDGEEWNEFCFRTVDAIIVKHRGKWKNIGRRARIECYRALHVDVMYKFSNHTAHKCGIWSAIPVSEQY